MSGGFLTFGYNGTETFKFGVFGVGKVLYLRYKFLHG